MTRDEILARYPNASESFIQRNLTPAADVVREPPTPVVERDISTPLAPAEDTQAGRPAKCLIRIESRRVQLQDPDNGVEKWHIDALRYAGLIPNDTPDQIEIRKSQTRVHSKEEEGTIITLHDVEEFPTD